MCMGRPALTASPKGWIATGPDRDIRVADNEIDPEHMRIIPHEYEEGVVYDRGGLVSNWGGPWRFYRYCLRFGSNMAAGSLFTAMTQDTMKLIAQAQGADVFLHEVAAARPEIQAANPAVGLVMAHHASPTEWDASAQTRPKLALLTHMVLLKLILYLLRK